jgi:hypothetical protein
MNLFYPDLKLFPCICALKRKREAAWAGMQTSENNNTSAIADVMTLGMGSVVSPIPKLMTLASGYFFR